MNCALVTFSALLKQVMLFLLKLYQLFLSPLLGTNCRHLPTCSHYAREALDIYGPLRGSYITVKRILRCHPWAEPAFDPVPSPSEGSLPAIEDKG